MKTGTFTLGDQIITAAGTYVGAPIVNLDGMRSISVQARFLYGAGGTNARVYIQTSLDGGTTWLDLACLLFATANVAPVIFNVTSEEDRQPVPATDGALTDDTILNGPLGDRLRMKVVTTGTYSGYTTVSGRVTVR